MSADSGTSTRVPSATTLRPIPPNTNIVTETISASNQKNRHPTVPDQMPDNIHSSLKGISPLLLLFLRQLRAYRLNIHIRHIRILHRSLLLRRSLQRLDA